MEQYKQEFIEFMVDSEVLKFGEFTLKSGRTVSYTHLKKWQGVQWQINRRTVSL